MIKMPMQCGSQHTAFNISPFTHQIIRRIGMPNRLHILMNDWAFI